MPRWACLACERQLIPEDGGVWDLAFFSANRKRYMTGKTTDALCGLRDFFDTEDNGEWGGSIYAVYRHPSDASDDPNIVGVTRKEAKLVFMNRGQTRFRDGIKVFMQWSLRGLLRDLVVAIRHWFQDTLTWKLGHRQKAVYDAKRVSVEIGALVRQRFVPGVAELVLEYAGGVAAVAARTAVIHASTASMLRHAAAIREDRATVTSAAAEIEELVDPPAHPDHDTWSELLFGKRKHAPRIDNSVTAKRVRR